MKNYILAAVLLILPLGVAAQTADFGTTYLTGIGLGSQDIRLTIVSLIRVALGILGVLMMVLIIYGVVGSGGDADRAAKARKIIAGAVIGLIIIIVAYAATTWIFNSIIDATIAG